MVLKERVKKLKEDLLTRDEPYFKQANQSEVGNFIDLKIKCLPRDYKIGRNPPTIFRKALAYEETFKNFTPIIYDSELIVGEPIRNCFPPFLFEDEQKLFENPTGCMTPTNVVPDYEKILKEGFISIKTEAQLMLDKEKNLLSPNEMWFLKSVILCCDSIFMLNKKYSLLASNLEMNEKNTKRKRELRRIAEICKKVPYYPANSFYEAIQSIWFVHLALRADDSFHIPIGRFDQILYPYYVNDIKKGLINNTQVEELIDCLWIKFNSIHSQKYYFEGDNGQSIVLGGLDKKGNDATNELSYMSIESSIRLKMIHPSLKVRINGRTPPSFIKKACELSIIGTGSPLFCNDEIIIPSLLKVGYTPEDARDYVTSACAEILIPGKSNNRPNWGEVCFLRCLESTINNGRSFIDNNEIGLIEGYLYDNENFNDLMENLKKQISNEINIEVNKCNEKYYCPSPLLSATMTDCIKNKKDISMGGCTYNNIGVWGSGLANTVDGLIAIKEHIYEKNRYSLNEIYSALKNNFYKKEDLRLVLLNKSKKFGCDENEVDLLAKEISEYFSDELLKHLTKEGGRYLPSLVSAWSYVFVGKKIGASPDGRKAGEPFADNFSPSSGSNSKGPSAAIKSLTKIDLTKFPNGAPSIIRFAPATFEGNEKIDKFYYFIRSFISLGGSKIQFNFVSNKILKKAQLEPEKYKDLIVRVWGFSAYFVTLTKEFQDSLIKRYEYSNM